MTRARLAGGSGLLAGLGRLRYAPREAVRARAAHHVPARALGAHRYWPSGWLLGPSLPGDATPGWTARGSAAEIGVLFTGAHDRLRLIWGKPTWGTV